MSLAASAGSRRRCPVLAATQRYQERQEKMYTLPVLLADAAEIVKVQGWSGID